jgi:hypothetical protein
MNAEKKKKTTEPMAIIEGYANTISAIETLWLDVRMTEMVDRTLKESADSQFAKILSNGFVIRASWIRDLRLGKPREKSRVHKTLAATNKLIEDLNFELAAKKHLKTAILKMIDQELMVLIKDDSEVTS